MKYLLDTNICIRILNKSSQSVVNRLEETDLDDIAIPAVVAAELMYGAQKSVRRDRNVEMFRTFIRQFMVVGLDADAIEAYGEIRSELERKGTPIGANDYFIAAISRSTSRILVTNNIREFSRVEGLVVEDWTMSVA